MPDDFHHPTMAPRSPVLTVDDLRLIGDRVLVDPDPRPTVSDSGLIVYPDVAVKDNPDWFAISGTVRKLGQGVRADRFLCRVCGHVFDQASGPRGDCDKCHAAMRGTNVELRSYGVLGPFSVRVGDRVTFNRFAGIQVELDEYSERAWHALMMTGLPPKKRYLLMRDHDVTGVADPGTDIRQKARAITIGKITDGLTPTQPVRS